LQTIQALTQFSLGKADPFLLAGEMKHRLKYLSRYLTFTHRSFKIGKFAFETAQVSAAVGNQID
jgi:hypothetical protein